MIQVKEISKVYNGRAALGSTTKVFDSGTTNALLGPSGCGKSTLLRIILGLITPDSGSVTIDDDILSAANINRLRTKVGYVIQDGGLFPHLTAEQNVALLARYLKTPDQKIISRIGELGELTKLSPPLLKRYPSELSGGQRQRVGLMRALMLDPPTLLLDEPLGALDAITRNELQTQLKEIFRRLKKTVVLVTHDLGEAAYLADEISLMRDGNIVQTGTMRDLAKRPSSPYVTEFLNAQRGPKLTDGAYSG